MSVIRSIVYGVVGPCKTESSQKPVPMHPTLADALMQWRKRCTYIKPLIPHNRDAMPLDFRHPLVFCVFQGALCGDEKNSEF
jgi:hypothetical protein